MITFLNNKTIFTKHFPGGGIFVPWFLSGCAFITLIFGCGTGDPAKRDRSLILKKLDGTMLTKAEADKAAANLAGLLPDTIDSFIAGEPPTVSNLPPEAMIAVERKYRSATQELIVELMTGDIRKIRGIVESDEEHSFGSDSYVYWRTVDIKGHRARIGEDKRKVNQSVLYMLIGPYAAAMIDVRGQTTTPGQSAAIAAFLDFETIKEAAVKLKLPALQVRG